MLKLIDCGKHTFISRNMNKKVYCFGAGERLSAFLEEDYGLKICGVIDNYKNGSSIIIDGQPVTIISLKEFVNLVDKNTVIVITCLTFGEIVSQMDKIEALNDIECYITVFLDAYIEETYNIQECDIKNKKIPKKIHYCWFGKGEMPDLYKNNIQSWKKYCSDYEIIRWDESNYDITKNGYMQQAYENKKWAFVSDYARVDIVCGEGGIYLDTDVEVLKSFDKFLGWNMFCGYENNRRINFGLGFGAVKNHEILQRVLEQYTSLSFVDKNGNMNMAPCTIYQSKVMREFGFELNGKFQIRKEVAVYPKDFFSPINYCRSLGKITANSHSIHWYTASWFNEEKFFARERLKESIDRTRARMIKMC